LPLAVGSETRTVPTAAAIMVSPRSSSRHRFSGSEAAAMSIGREFVPSFFVECGKKRAFLQQFAGVSGGRTLRHHGLVHEGRAPAELAMSVSLASSTHPRHPELPTEDLFKLFRASIKDDGDTGHLVNNLPTRTSCATITNAPAAA
jgi:hypothetical protein